MSPSSITHRAVLFKRMFVAICVLANSELDPEKVGAGKIAEIQKGQEESSGRRGVHLLEISATTDIKAVQ